ncbi:LmeA family phospholipid-binding protein [Cellulomonas dongxiuzhuiae]|uniref:DUF2993 domain-containing protein n=1 Tax=Cellulomonas dongxiuzhuiae TaxID=2819979 RepID=A0ABX8GI99_9CELL|nr:LmeA family phospholipid-binding protein [Cellulomonas dongxiuzhuiae]MBO3094717.1 hypothetical protein [Cellulomonas dongxiuzhuiae]QWC15720.1 DUF2993 domain-containing protein [Cellulomonas dongxiuzhuiae]
MERRRLVDGLVGAGVAVLVMVAVVVVAAFALTRPASSKEPAAGPTTQADPAGGAPPDDLAAGDLWLGGLTLDADTLATPDGTLHDVEVTGEDVRTGASGLVAGALTVDATVPFALVAAQIGPDVRVGPVPGSPDEAAVHRTFEGLGRVLDVEATGTVTVRAGRLVIEPRTIDIGGPGFLADLFGALARELVTIEQEIEGMPDGLVLRDVTVQGDGFRAALRGTDVRIEP